MLKWFKEFAVDFEYYAKNSVGFAILIAVFLAMLILGVIFVVGLGIAINTKLAIFMAFVWLVLVALDYLVFRIEV